MRKKWSMNGFVYKLYAIVWITLICRWLLLMNGRKLINERICLDNINMQAIVINEWEKCDQWMGFSINWYVGGCY